MIQTVTALIYYRLFIAGEPASQDVADGAAAAERDGALASRQRRGPG